MPLVSVIVPYFKKKKYIQKTINSITSQSYKNLEIIIIYDDEDLTDLKLLNKIKISDKRIKLLINKKNLGAGQSRNIGIKKAKAKYIAFLDADDLWKRNKVKLQLEFMVKNKLEISHTDYEVLKIDKKTIMRAKIYKNYKELLTSCDIGLSTVMLKKRLITKNCQFSKLKTKEDFVLWLLILKKNFMIGALNKNLTTWRKLNDSLSSSVVQKLRDGYMLYYKCMGFNFFKSLIYLFLLSINSLIK